MNTENKIQLNDQDVAVCAYHLWESGGRQVGRDAEYWFQAQSQLKARGTSQGASARRDGSSNQASAKQTSAVAPKQKSENGQTQRRQPAFA